MDQASFAKHFKMLADGGLRQRRVADDVVGDAHLALRQELNNLEAHRVAQGFEHFHQALPVTDIFVFVFVVHIS